MLQEINESDIKGTLKLEKRYMDGLLSGMKPYELRAKEKLGFGGIYHIVDSINGLYLATVELELIGSITKIKDGHLVHTFMDKRLDYSNDNIHFKNYIESTKKHLCYLANSGLYHEWVNHYFEKKQTPAFYRINDLVFLLDKSQESVKEFKAKQANK